MVAWLPGGAGPHALHLDSFSSASRAARCSRRRSSSRAPRRPAIASLRVRVDRIEAELASQEAASQALAQNYDAVTSRLFLLDASLRRMHNRLRVNQVKLAATAKALQGDAVLAYVCGLGRVEQRRAVHPRRNQNDAANIYQRDRHRQRRGRRGATTATRPRSSRPTSATSAPSAPRWPRSAGTPQRCSQRTTPSPSGRTASSTRWAERCTASSSPRPSPRPAPRRASAPSRRPRPGRPAWRGSSAAPPARSPR